MSKIKTITTTIEDEVVFMVDPKVEFVSLVKHGANRAPFKVIKHEKPKEETNMNKVVQSVLVRNDLNEEDMAKALEGIDRREAKKFQTFTSYQQVPVEKCAEGSLTVIKHEDNESVLLVVGDLPEGGNDGGTIIVEVDEKQAVDYATLDNLYSELYAMADIVGGALRQENAEADFRKTTILQTIDNFRAYAEMTLESLSTEKMETPVKAEDHPTLVTPLVQEKKDDEEGEAEEGDEKTDDGKVEDKKADGEESKDVDFDGFVTAFNAAMTDFGDKLIETLTTATKEISDTNKKTQEAVEGMVKSVEDLQNTAIASKSEVDDDTPPKDEKKSTPSFKGAFFRGFSDFNR